MDRSFGEGKIVKKNGKIMYQGTFPEVKIGEKFVILPKVVLESMVRTDENSLLNTGKPMDKDLYDNSNLNHEDGSKSPPFFEDELDYIAKDGKYKLYLDRHLYTRNPKDMIWVRYVNVDESLIEEWKDLINGKKF